MKTKVKHGLAAAALILFMASSAGILGLVGISFWGCIILILIACLCLWGIDILHN
jgi:hypothetical protein